MRILVEHHVPQQSIESSCCTEAANLVFRVNDHAQRERELRWEVMLRTELQRSSNALIVRILAIVIVIKNIDTQSDEMVIAITFDRDIALELIMKKSNGYRSLGHVRQGVCICRDQEMAMGLTISKETLLLTKKVFESREVISRSRVLLIPWHTLLGLNLGLLGAYTGSRKPFSGRRLERLCKTNTGRMTQIGCMADHQRLGHSLLISADIGMLEVLHSNPSNGNPDPSHYSC